VKLIATSVSFFPKTLALWQNIKTTETVGTEKINKTRSYKKAALKMLMKLTPGVNFINVLRTHFLHNILALKITKVCFGFEIFLAPKY